MHSTLLARALMHVYRIYCARASAGALTACGTLQRAARAQNTCRACAPYPAPHFAAQSPFRFLYRRISGTACCNTGPCGALATSARTRSRAWPSANRGSAHAKCLERSPRTLHIVVVILSRALQITARVVPKRSSKGPTWSGARGPIATAMPDRSNSITTRRRPEVSVRSHVELLALRQS